MPTGYSCSDNPVHWVIDLIRKWRVKQRIGYKEFAKRITLRSHTGWHNYEVGHTKLSQFYFIETILDNMGYELIVRKKTRKRKK